VTLCAVQNGQVPALLAQRLAASLAHLDQNAANVARSEASAAIALLISDFKGIFRYEMPVQYKRVRAGPEAQLPRSRPDSGRTRTAPRPLVNVLTSISAVDSGVRPSLADVSNNFQPGLRQSGALERGFGAGLLHHSKPSMAPAALARLVATGAALTVSVGDDCALCLLVALHSFCLPCFIAQTCNAMAVAVQATIGPWIVAQLARLRGLPGSHRGMPTAGGRRMQKTCQAASHSLCSGRVTSDAAMQTCLCLLRHVRMVRCPSAIGRTSVRSCQLTMSDVWWTLRELRMPPG
jgi:hypothetical protein